MSKLLFRSTASHKSTMSEKHILVRVVNYLPTLFLTRKCGRPVDLLVRVPVSTLSCNPNDSKLLKANKILIEPYKLNWKTLINARYFLVPKRNFGLGRRNPDFGHKSFRVQTHLMEAFAFFSILIILVMCLVDWRKLKEDYGIEILPLYLYKAFTQANIDGDGREMISPKNSHEYASSESMVLTEHSQNIHAYMERQAEIRLLKRVAAQDPEIAALVEGKTVDKPVDAEMFKLKKEYVEGLNLTTQDLLDPSDKPQNIQEYVDDQSTKWNWLGKKFVGMWNVKAEEVKEIETDFDDLDKKDEKKVGFKDRKIIEYENRIRSYSTPDKIFRYFATYRVVDEKGHQEVMMTPHDFLRSITPGIQQPANKGLDQFTNITKNDINSLAKDFKVDQSSIFNHLGSGGLITFSDYLFLLTVLSTSRRHFEIAFKMFDLNGDGNVDAKEFENVTNLMRSQSSMGARHRDHGNTGSTLKGINSGLITYFFGHNRKGILTVDDFLEFQRRLQNEILRLEFDRKRASSSEILNPDGEPVISEKDFGDLLIAYAGFPAKKKERMLKRVKNTFDSKVKDEADVANNHSKYPKITLADYLNFYQVLYAINDIDTALTFYNMAGAPIQRKTMQHVAQTVANVKLSDHVVDVVFVLFDEDGDGKLSNKEFISVMKQRAMRGLEKPKDTGIGRIFSALSKCAATHSQPTILGGSRKTE